MFYPNAGLTWRVVLSSFFNHGLDKWQKLFADEIDFGDPIGSGTNMSLYLVVVAEVLLLFLLLWVTRLDGHPYSLLWQCSLQGLLLTEAILFQKWKKPFYTSLVTHLSS